MYVFGVFKGVAMLSATHLHNLLSKYCAIVNLVLGTSQYANKTLLKINAMVFILHLDHVATDLNFLHGYLN